jgi:hypothetical protein
MPGTGAAQGAPGPPGAQGGHLAGCSLVKTVTTTAQGQTGCAGVQRSAPSYAKLASPRRECAAHV